MRAFATHISPWQGRALSVLRVVAGLLVMQHGLQKLLSFPTPFARPVAMGELIWFAGLIEIVGGILVVIGFQTRIAAFVLSGLLAFAYFIGHASRGFYPIVNGGNLAVLYCFVFLYLATAGPGPWSLDAKRGDA